MKTKSEENLGDIDIENFKVLPLDILRVLHRYLFSLALPEMLALPEKLALLLMSLDIHYSR